ncbi:hypothetical protein ACFL2J_07965, partial [Candidatus Omnitrophota bacterium]
MHKSISRLTIVLIVIAGVVLVAATGAFVPTARSSGQALAEAPRDSAQESSLDMQDMQQHSAVETTTSSATQSSADSTEIQPIPRNFQSENFRDSILEIAPQFQRARLNFGSEAAPQLEVLDEHSSPKKGETWGVRFTTQGKSDLKIIPDDQATIDDDEFTGLYQGDLQVQPQILEDDVIFYPDWQYDDVARVEHKTLKRGDHTLKFEFGDDTDYAHNTAWGVSEINSLEFDGADATHNSLILLDSTHFVVSYQGVLGDGWAKTFSFDANYDNITELDDIEHDNKDGRYNSMVKIDDTHWILAFAGNGDDGFITTFSANPSTYVISEEDVLEHDASDTVSHNSLVIWDSTHFMLSYEDAVGAGYLKTFSIDGSFNLTEIDSDNCNTYSATGDFLSSIVKIDDTHVMQAQQVSNGWPFMRTGEIDGSYNITNTWIDGDGPTHASSEYFSLAKIDDTHYMLAYSLTSGSGWIRTYSIDGSYSITEEDALNHETVSCSYNSLVKIDDTRYMLAYAGADDDGYITVFSIDGNYDITEETTLEHDAVNGTYNSLVKIDDTHYGLAYTGLDGDGYIKTFSLDFGSPTVALNSPNDAAGITDLTPTLNFTGTDPDTEDVEYNVQVGTDNSFSGTWDVTSAVYSQEKSLKAKESAPQGLFFKPDGTKMYTIGTAG